MVSSRPKRKKATSYEHIIPASYLQGFANKEGILCVYEQNKQARESVPTRECAEHQFYEFKVGSRKSNNEFENWLANIEGNGKRIIPLLCDNKQLETEDRIAWAVYVALLFVRTRKVRMQISTVMVRKMRELVTSTEYVRNLQHEMFKQGEFYFADELRSFIEKYQTAVESSPSYYHVTSLPRQTRMLADILLRMKWSAISACDGAFFVTTDCPVITVQRQMEGVWGEGAGFAKGDVVVFLPLTTKYVFAASAYFKFKDVAEAVYVDRINRALVHFAHKNVYADRNVEWVKLLVDAEINQTVFGKNAFRPVEG